MLAVVDYPRLHKIRYSRGRISGHLGLGLFDFLSDVSPVYCPANREEQIILPPISRCVHLQPIIPDSNLVGNHPANNPISKDAREDINFHCSNKQHWSIILRHVWNAEIQTDNTKE
jgi:hypothetical protein